MYVSDIMTKDTATVPYDASVSTAFKVLYERKYSQLPVVDGDKLVGLITEKLLAQLSPSKATSLSVYEINYLLSKTKVKDVLIKDVFTVKPDALLEEAALIMYNNDIGSLPVVLEDKTLVGMLTRLDIFKALIDVLGVNDSGTRISIEVNDDIGVVADIAQIFKDLEANIKHISNFSKDDGSVEIVISANITDADELRSKLEGCGYKVTRVDKY